MDPSTSVAARLAALSLDGKGRLTSQLLASAAVRAGLLVDLALARRLRLTADSIELDARPVGLQAADRLLLAMDAEPERTLDSWLDERRIDLGQVADSLAEAGAWTRHRTLLGLRYRVGHPAQRTSDLQLDVESDDPPADVATAAVAVLAAVAGLVGEARTASPRMARPAIPPAALAATGAQEWIVRAAADHLDTIRAGFAAWPHSTGAGGPYG